MTTRPIEIRGARTHHLKDLSLDLPRERWTVVCGVSGSGKTSLVLDTLGAESYRRFLGTLERGAGPESIGKPDVDRIDGLPPAVSAGFSARAPGPRETVASVADVLASLRTLFARAATPHCPRCDAVIRAVSPGRTIGRLLAHPEGTKIVLLAPRGTGEEALAAARRDGYVRVRIAGRIVRLDEGEAVAGATDPVEVVVDRLVVKPDAHGRFAEAVDQASRIGGGVVRASIERPSGADARPVEESFADRPFCSACAVAYPALSPASFSFDAVAGACPACGGLGTTPSPDPERVLPREARLSRAWAHVAPALVAEERPALRRAFLRAVTEAKLTPRDRVAGLPEDLRARLLGTVDGDGLLGALVRRGRFTRFALDAPCEACKGARLSPYPAAARLGAFTLPQLLAASIREARALLAALEWSGAEGALARPVRDDVLARLVFLDEVGLSFVSLGRRAASLSSGELRRTRLAAACAARMSGLLYLLDEPTMGLHPSERAPLRARLRRLVDEGNTVVAVEHDPSSLLAADYVVELGPGAGIAGGSILEQGRTKDVLARATAPIARALAERATTPARKRTPRPAPTHWITLVGARRRNLAGIDATFANPGLTCVTGVSGSGKSTLVFDVLGVAARAVLARAPFPSEWLVRLDGLGAIDRVASSEGRAAAHPRATAGGVLGVLDPLRGLFAATVEARARGYGPRRFSTHVDGGRCAECRGLGVRAVRLRHLPELAAPCDACEGRRFRPETLEIRVKGLSIADVLEMPVARAAEVFRDLPGVGRPLAAAADVGLAYVRLGEATDRLSGGEALRLKLAAALGRAGRGRTLYLLDEPCAGLHPTDVVHLVKVLRRLADGGDAVVATEHHAALILEADHVIDLGPDAGALGGRVVVEGTPAEVAAHRPSRTGAYLR